MHCLTGCESERYEVVTSEALLGNENTFHHSQHFCIVLRSRISVTNA